MSFTLFINKSDSHCEKYHPVRNDAPGCERCGQTFTHVSSMYGGLANQVIPMRPDLIPHFPWENWWQSEAGKRAQQELGDFNTATDEVPL